LGVNEKTVRNWAAEGVIESERTPAGRYRLPAAVVPVLKELVAQGIPLDARELKNRLPRKTTAESGKRTEQPEEDRQATKAH
jgi:hypothetical protein